MGSVVCGRIVPERRNPLNGGQIALYRPALRAALAAPWVTIAAALLLVASMAWPLDRIGTAFMPDLDAGALLYMPSLLPAVSICRARAVLQLTERLIKPVPAVDLVHGQLVRAATATDQAARPSTRIQ